jgi:hypothetical protein
MDGSRNLMREKWSTRTMSVLAALGPNPCSAGAEMEALLLSTMTTLAQERQVPGCGAQTPSIFVGNASLDLMECEMDKMSIP